MPRILYTTSELRHPPTSGPWLRVRNSIKSLSRVAQVTLVCRAPLAVIGGNPAVEYYREICSDVHLFTEPVPARSASRILELASNAGADVIWLGYGNVSYELLLHLRLQKCRLPVVVDTDSIWSRFVLRGMPYQNDLRRRMEVFLSGWFKRWEESWGTRLGTMTTAVSRLDADYYRIFSEDQNAVQVFSNVLDPADYRLRCGAVPIRKPCLCLTGTFFPDCPMKEAAEWMLQKVLPKVWEAIPETTFYVAGYESDKYLPATDDPRVIITGTLPSILPYLCQADVAVVPLKFESGTRIKIKEAAVCNVPIVSTTLGAEGLPVLHGEHLLIADTPDAFAQAVIQLLKDPGLRIRLTQNCRRLIEETYSITAASRQAEEIFEFLLPPGRCASPAVSEALLHSISQVYSHFHRADMDGRLFLATGLIRRLFDEYGGHPLFTLAEEASTAIAMLGGDAPDCTCEEDLPQRH